MGKTQPKCWFGRNCAAQLSLNTVQLVDKNCALRWFLGLRMVLVVTTFGGPFEDFAFDDAGVGALAACGIDPALQESDGVIPQPEDRVVAMRGKKSCATVIFE